MRGLSDLGTVEQATRALALTVDAQSTAGLVPRGLRVGAKLAITRLHVLLRHLLSFQLPFDEVVLAKARARDLVLAHGSVLLPDTHEQVPLLQEHLFMQVFLQALSHSSEVVLGGGACFG